MDKRFREHLEHVIAKEGLAGLQKRIDSGFYGSLQKDQALAFISEVTQRNLTAYMLSPEFSALRQANAAEKSNKMAHRALIVSLFSAFVASVALALQLFGK